MILRYNFIAIGKEADGHVDAILRHVIALHGLVDDV